MPNSDYYYRKYKKYKMLYKGGGQRGLPIGKDRTKMEKELRNMWEATLPKLTALINLIDEMKIIAGSLASYISYPGVDFETLKSNLTFETSTLAEYIKENPIMGGSIYSFLLAYGSTGNNLNAILSTIQDIIGNLQPLHNREMVEPRSKEKQETDLRLKEARSWLERRRENLTLSRQRRDLQVKQTQSTYLEEMKTLCFSIKEGITFINNKSIKLGNPPGSESGEFETGWY